MHPAKLERGHAGPCGAMQRPCGGMRGYASVSASVLASVSIKTVCVRLLACLVDLDETGKTGSQLAQIHGRLESSISQRTDS